jgi:hypothetical protein
MKKEFLIVITALLLYSCQKQQSPAPEYDNSDFVRVTDVIPDAIPIAGLGDDLAVLIYVLHKIWGDISEEVKSKAKNKLKEWFDSDELKAIDDLFKEDPTEDPV